MSFLGLGSSHAVYWRTSSIQEVLIEDKSLTWRSLSGIIDLYFYSGPTIHDAISQFVTSIGTPALPPYWALGYHQSRWGYGTVGELNEVVHKFKEANIPLETIWSDIDYMENHRDFTIDRFRFPEAEFTRFLQTLHYNGHHYIPIVDTGVYAPQNGDENYPVYFDGLADDVYLKNPDGSVYIGEVWPGPSAFPDFFANSTKDWWTKALKDWYRDVQFDGIWLDKNEPTSHCMGSCGKPPTGEPTDEYLETIEGRGDVNHPPYVINNIRDEGCDLAAHYVAPNATHQDGSLEFDLHNLYGYSESKVTYESLLDIFPGKRPFVLSRSTHTGSGKYSVHWGGDNESKWSYLQFSISQAFSFGLFGIPFFGADICGFSGNAEEEMCSRWMQLGAFFPFYRNHNTVGTIHQEPYCWESVAEATRNATSIRYSLLSYYYTLLAYANLKDGLPVMRALSWVFPGDASLFGIDSQFFIGDALLITPVLEPNTDKVEALFPGIDAGEVYYDWYTMKKVSGEPRQALDAPLGHIPIHIRGGNIIPVHVPGYTTRETKENPIKLIVALDENNFAEGSLFWDDGESLDTKDSMFYKYRAEGGSLFVQSSQDEGYLAPTIDMIYVLGGPNRFKEIDFTANRDQFFMGVISLY
ncbi:unnamed protein product [Ambrosiozyma monospora]|uniref:Unnamed protein product n=1 Tax=Ambrosiozyma monospora TaxID=43982 RepID=A0ACB5T7D6_AMBMO|nr:unnamed protein product [Ambrosiozyma monospora]